MATVTRGLVGAAVAIGVVAGAAWAAVAHSKSGVSEWLTRFTGGASANGKHSRNRLKSRNTASDAAVGEKATPAAVGEADRRPYEERTARELYELAAERNIRGRSSMNKAALIEALRSES